MTAPVRGSYFIADDQAGFDAEVDRLERQAELTWPKERESLERLALPDGADILDVGCGPGAFLARLAAMFPAAGLTGLEPNRRLLDRARLRLGERAAFLETSIGDVATDRRFDLVVCRYVLQHLPHAQEAVATLLRLLKPGGHALLIDVDADLLGVSEPWNGALAAIYRRAGLRQNRLGGNRTVGRRLYRMLRDAGFSDIRLEAGVVHSDETDVRLFDHQMAPELLDAALAEGAISPADHALVASEHQRFLAATEPLVVMLFFMATGRAA